MMIPMALNFSSVRYSTLYGFRVWSIYLNKCPKVFDDGDFSEDDTFLVNALVPSY